MAEVRVTGDKAAIAALSRAAREIADLSDPTREAARAVEQRAARLSPRSTGRLAAANRSSVSGGVGTISNRTRYAGYQEYGTSVMHAHPYLRPALYTAPIEKFYEQHVDRVVHRI